MELRKKLSGSLAVAVVGMMAAGSANAGLTKLTISYDQAYTGYITGGGASGEDVYLTAFSAYQNSGPGNGDPLPIPTTNPFITFCCDIAPNLIPTDWWQSETFDQAGAGNTVTYVTGGIQRAASIYNHYVSSVDISTVSGQQYGAALQLAIWNVLYDTDTSVTSGTGFYVTGANASVTDLANTMLTSAYNTANPNLNSTFWNATDANGNPVYNQDLIGPQLETGFVPEPGIFTAAASGCALVGLLGLRRKQALS